MRFTLVRHGETVENQEHIVQGQLPGELSNRGRSQVRKTARELASTTFSHIYSSDLNRCRQTTEILSEHHKQTPVTYDKRIRERFFGDWEGLVYEKTGMWDMKKGGLLNQTPPRGETLADHVDRTVDFINEKLNRHNQNDNVLVVSHGGTIRFILALYYSIPLPNLWVIKTANAQAVFLDINKPLPSRIDVIE